MSSYRTLLEIGKVLIAETDLNKLLPILMDKVIEQKQRMISDFEREFISKILQETRGNISEAARRSGMYKKNLIDKMKQYGIKQEDFVRRAKGGGLGAEGGEPGTEGSEQETKRIDCSLLSTTVVRTLLW